MSRFGSRLLLACLLMGFGVFYGLDMARNGTEYVNGPLEQLSSESESEVSQPQPPVEESLPEIEADPPSEVLMHELRPVTADKAIHRMANKTGGVIQATLQGGVEIIVSLFEGVVH